MYRTSSFAWKKTQILSQAALGVIFFVAKSFMASSSWASWRPMSFSKPFNLSENGGTG